MKKDVILTLWVLSFIAMVILVENPYKISFWISFGIEKHNKRFEHEDE